MSFKTASLKIVEALDLMRKGALTSTEVTTACINRANEYSALNCFTQYCFSSALQEAEQCTAERKKNDGGHIKGELHGIPYAIKDNICDKNLATTASSKMLENYKSTFDATSVEKFRSEKGIILGKLNMDEFGMGSATSYSSYGPSYNPWSPALSLPNQKMQTGSEEKIVGDTDWLSPGGSSGGAAAAVAVGAAMGALGSDTGGSVRQPAAWCGVVGLKPTYGRISRHGLIAYASSLDTVGVLARSAADCAVLLDAAAGPDPLDSTCLREYLKVNHFKAAVGITEETPTGKSLSSLKGFRIGIPQEFHIEGMEDEIVRAWDDTVHILSAGGAEIVPLSLPTVPFAVPAYIVLASAEAASNLARYDGIRYGGGGDGGGAASPLWTAAGGSGAAAAAAEEEAALAAAARGLFGDQAALHALYTLARTRHFGPEVKRRILSGNFVLSSEAYHDYYELADWARRRLRREFARAFGPRGAGGGHAGCDALLAPTAPLLPAAQPPPPPGGNGSGVPRGDQKGQMAVDYGKEGLGPAALFRNDAATVPASLAGVPAISLPVGLARAGLPIGMQIMGNHKDEATVLKIALFLENQINFSSKHPVPCLK